MTSQINSISGQTPAEVAVKAAIEAGAILRKQFYEPKDIHLKSRGNVVTKTDIESQNCIIEILRREFPDFGVIGEESVEISSDSGYTWLIDPLDGSNNFTFGIPFFAINIALIHHSEIVLGLTSDPLREEFFIAERNKGCRLNGKVVKISQNKSLKTAFMGCDLGYDDRRGKQTTGIVSSLWPNMHGMRLLGSAALGLAYVACGRFHLYFHRFLYPWDIASGILMVKEAGGEAVDWEGLPANMRSQTVVASNIELINQFFNEIKPLRLSSV